MMLYQDFDPGLGGEPWTQTPREVGHDCLDAQPAAAVISTLPGQEFFF